MYVHDGGHTQAASLVFYLVVSQLGLLSRQGASSTPPAPAARLGRDRLGNLHAALPAAAPAAQIPPKENAEIKPLQWQELGAGCCEAKSSTHTFSEKLGSQADCQRKCASLSQHGCSHYAFGWPTSGFCVTYSKCTVAPA